jgi:GNAT superfamily N-acetyltransferase
MIIVKTTGDLVPRVVEIAEATAEDKLSAEQKRHFVFLRPYSAEQYMRFTQLADHFYSVLEGDRLVAFLLAHASDKIELTEEVYAYIQSKQTKPFIVTRQLTVAPDLVRKGYGRILYNHMIERATTGSVKYETAIGFIWKEPNHNVASEDFNRKMGSREIGTYTLKDGRGLVGIWEIPLIANRGCQQSIHDNAQATRATVTTT